MGKEIERKWLLTQIPEGLENAIHREIQVIYLSICPEVRLRRIYNYHTKEVKYVATIKSCGGLERAEFEIPVDEIIWMEAIKIYAPVIKDLYEIAYEGYNIEFNNVENGDMFYAEVEFITIEEANAYIFPYTQYLNKEVTEDYRYKMREYWLTHRI